MGRSRSWRRHQKNRVIENRLRMLRQLPWVTEGQSSYSTAGPWYDQTLAKKNYLGKRRPLGCGKPRCSLCHFEKFYQGKDRYNEKRKAIQEELRHAA